MKLVKKVIAKAKLNLITGLHIGDSSDSVEIGGVDLPVVRVRFMEGRTRQPYIPGSSLKGKMRCLLEQTRGATQIGGAPEVNHLFGITENKKKNLKNIPSRLIVRDAYLTEETAKKLEKSEFTDLPFTEIKWENSIKRVEGAAEHPRQIERVPAGAAFDLQFIINVFQNPAIENWEEASETQKLKGLLEEGIKLLNHDYLGGSGSRGYGQVEISNLTYEEIVFNHA